MADLNSLLRAINPTVATPPAPNSLATDDAQQNAESAEHNSDGLKQGDLENLPESPDQLWLPNATITWIGDRGFGLRALIGPEDLRLVQIVGTLSFLEKSTPKCLRFVWR